MNSILKMEYPKSLYEIIVVDGGSTDGTEELCQSFPEVRCVTEKRLGLAYARNRGAELARGSIVAYTDDDCIVDTNWLKYLVSALQIAKSYVGVGGPVFPLDPKIIPRKIRVDAALGLFDAGESVKPVKNLITANAAFKKELFNTVRFDEALHATRRGRFILSGEDVDFCQTLVESGYRLLYTPHAKVYHQIPRERMRVRYIVKRAMHDGISATLSNLKKRNSRPWAVGVAVWMVIQCYWTALSESSFTSCYLIVRSLSTLLVSLTGLDRIVL